MQITRGTANPSWRWTDVRDDHQGVASILDDGRSVTAYTQSRVDFRPGIVFSLKNRRFDHWTPRYLRYRLQAAIRAALRPEEPSLTPQAVRELDRRLTRDMVGVEWGSGNTTRFFARRTRHLTSFETDTSYYDWVAGTLRAEGLENVDYRLIPHDFEGEDDEEEMHRNAVVVAADQFADESFDYALIDSAPRGCLSRRIAAKIKPGGLLILDNANWYLPPPATLRPAAPGSVSQVLGTSGSIVTHHECWPAFARLIANWGTLWSSNGVQMTLVLIKPRA
jgi:SAM-dependent methyltransferase